MVIAKLDLSLVITAYNEASTLEGVISELIFCLRNNRVRFEIIVVDNGSSDGTLLVCQNLAKVFPEVKLVCLSVNKGYGGGIVSGFKSSSGAVLGWCHADKQIGAEDVVNVYKNFSLGEYDLFKAFRINRPESWWRRLQSAVYNWLFSKMFGIKIKDINAVPKFITRGLYEALDIESQDWFIDAELIIKTVRLHKRIGEYGVKWSPRAGGKSKVHLFTSLAFLKNLLIYRFVK